MVLHAQNTTRVVVEMATRDDAFQGGREAAQAAIRQFQDKPIDMVLVLGANPDGYQELIEGVRLVTGEDNLIGIPTSRVVSNNQFEPHTSTIVMIQAPNQKLSIASTEVDPENFLKSSSSVIHQFRTQRMNQIHNFEHHGVLLFDGLPENGTLNPSREMAYDYGLNSLFMGIKPHNPNNHFMIQSEKSIKAGMVAIEYLSDQPWAMSSVDIHGFKEKPHITSDAAQTALRNAQNQLNDQSLSMGFLIFNFPIDDLPQTEVKSIFQKLSAMAPGIPFVGFSSDSQFIRMEDESFKNNNEALSMILIPQ